MLEGKEVEGKIGAEGQYGSYEVDVNDKGEVVAKVEVKIDLLAEIEKLAAKTATPIDDAAIAWIKKLLGK